MTDKDLHSHLIGRQGSRHDLNTPVLVIDRDALERNIERMAAFAVSYGLQLRPHAKTHKSADIARRQIAAGAVGQCCAKLGEAEALADAGIEGLLITSPIVSRQAIDRLVSLNARSAGLLCVLDNPGAAKAIAAAVSANGDRTLSVLIDIDPGIHRTGVASPEAAVELYRVIASEAAFNFAGVQFYCGSEQHIEAYADRTAAMQDRATYLRSVIDALKSAGADCRIVSGGGTGTHRIDATLKLFTELQAGSYIFMDDQYRACALTSEDGEVPFETALLIDTRVISANSRDLGLVTLDAGIKALSTDAKPPMIVSGAPEGSFFLFMGDEQGALVNPVTLPEIDAIVTLGAPHCDPTVNLYDFYHVVSDTTLVDIWPVSARGRSR